MKVTPKSEKELQESHLLPAGEYPFQISAAEDTVSKSGNDMIKMTVRVFKPNGQFNLVTDYLLASMEFKIRHACEACGILDKYESGELCADDFIGKEGMLKLIVKVDDKGVYADQNSIKDYIVQKDTDKKPLPKSELTKAIDDLEDSIPF